MFMTLMLFLLRLFNALHRSKSFIDCLSLRTTGAKADHRTINYLDALNLLIQSYVVMVN
jgi:hypothetical protein